jgi:uncharacterized protein with PIN domain
VIVIDSSALLAILNHEPERLAFFDAIADADRKLISAEVIRSALKSSSLDAALKESSISMSFWRSLAPSLSPMTANLQASRSKPLSATARAYIHRRALIFAIAPPTP